MFGKIIHEQRKKLGMTLAELGKKTGMSRGYLSGLENEKVNPPLPYFAFKLAGRLGLDGAAMVTLAWLEKAPGCAKHFVHNYSNLEKEVLKYLPVPEGTESVCAPEM